MDFQGYIVIVQYTDTDLPTVKKFNAEFSTDRFIRDESGWETMKRIDVWRVWSDGTTEHDPELTVLSDWW